MQPSSSKFTVLVVESHFAQSESYMVLFFIWHVSFFKLKGSCDSKFPNSTTTKLTWVIKLWISPAVAVPSGAERQWNQQRRPCECTHCRWWCLHTGQVSWYCHMPKVLPLDCHRTHRRAVIKLVMVEYGTFLIDWTLQHLHKEEVKPQNMIGKCVQASSTLN